jgi:predicted amidohydrolase
MPVKVGIVQAGSLLYNTAGTIEKMEELAKKAAKYGAKLVLFPGQTNNLLTNLFVSTFSYASIHPIKLY